ncbi:hypothetical protein QBC40DRAFT_272321 [Triangularia verruculosa]|uniref:Uncharacterized protein n=1 Tax=Triangularia verruculosa TaxID=2587418 RepID=A0AAN6XQN0_9PEZI|nr:hypothetical protein QBC40DRAFT_272321 [Triangularia verruculosa]
MLRCRNEISLVVCSYGFPLVISPFIKEMPSKMPKLLLMCISPFPLCVGDINQVWVVCLEKEHEKKKKKATLEIRNRNAVW